MSAEIDALFNLFVAGILLVWLIGYIKGWKPVVLWGLSFFLAGVAFLTKGPHAAVFFYFTVVAYLLLWKRLFLFLLPGPRYRHSYLSYGAVCLSHSSSAGDFVP